MENVLRPLIVVGGALALTLLLGWLADLLLRRANARHPETPLWGLLRRCRPPLQVVLLTAILRKGFVRLVFVSPQRFLQPFTAICIDLVKHIRVQPRNMNRVALDKAQIQRSRGLDPHRIRQVNIARVIHADVQDGTRAAPIGIFGTGPDTQQRGLFKLLKNSGQIRHLPIRYLMHRIKRQRDRSWNRQFQTNQTLQTFRPPAMRVGGNGRFGRDKRSMRIILHCGTF